MPLATRPPRLSHPAPPIGGAGRGSAGSPSALGTLTKTRTDYKMPSHWCYACSPLLGGRTTQCPGRASSAFTFARRERSRSFLRVTSGSRHLHGQSSGGRECGSDTPVRGPHIPLFVNRSCVRGHHAAEPRTACLVASGTCSFSPARLGVEPPPPALSLRGDTPVAPSRQYNHYMRLTSAYRIKN